jgi:hypothetical protein
MWVKQQSPEALNSNPNPTQKKIKRGGVGRKGKEGGRGENTLCILYFVD